MNIFTTRITNNQNWILPVSLMSGVLGFMVVSAAMTAKKQLSLKDNLDPVQVGRVANGPIDYQTRLQNLTSEVTKLRTEKTKLENALATQTGSTRVLNEQLQDVKSFAGLSAIQGPGVIVTLRDGNKSSNLMGLDRTIHDTDILKVVNELFASGAEAISVNGTRLSSRSSIRCVGPTVFIDGQRYAATPIVIQAIGDTPTLLGGLNIPEGVIEILKGTDPVMANVEGAKLLTLPAYSGPTEYKIAKPQGEKK